MKIRSIILATALAALPYAVLAVSPKILDVPGR